MMTPEEIQRTMDFILASQANSVVRMDRLEEDLKEQKETVTALLRISQDLLKVSANVVKRTKRLEGRADSVDEMLKVFRDLLEANLRDPEAPPEHDA